MEEQKHPEQVKKQLTPDQILAKNIQTMPNSQMSNRLKRLANSTGLKLKKGPLSNIDSTWAIVLSVVFDNTKMTGGQIEPFLR
jgi:hypothetical protein